MSSWDSALKRSSGRRPGHHTRAPSAGSHDENSSAPTGHTGRRNRGVLRVGVHRRAPAAPSTRAPLPTAIPGEAARWSHSSPVLDSRLSLRLPTGRRLSRGRGGKRACRQDRRLKPRDGPRERPQHAALLCRRPDAPTASAGAVHGQPIREPPGSGSWSHPGSFDWAGATAARVGALPELSRAAKRRRLE